MSGATGPPSSRRRSSARPAGRAPRAAGRRPTAVPGATRRRRPLDRADRQQQPPVARGRATARRLAGQDRAQPGGDVGVVVEAEHGVGLGQRLGQLLAVPLGQAADGDDGLGPAVRPRGRRPQQGVDGVLLGRLDEAAGVDQHGVGVGGVVDERPSRPASSRPASSSESTSLRAQPRVTSATVRAGGGRVDRRHLVSRCGHRGQTRGRTAQPVRRSGRRGRRSSRTTWPSPPGGRGRRR